jgi:hypothetical protein
MYERGFASMFDAQRVEVFENVLSVVRARRDVRANVFENRLLAEVVADHVRHEGVDRLVVGDSGARGVRKGHGAAPIRRKKASAAERGVGSEDDRVEVVVVDAPVDHVHPLEPLRRAHAHRTVGHAKVAALDERHAHAAREQAVLEVRRVVHTG